MNKLRLGTRGSRLALAQAHSISAMLRELNPGLEVEIVTIKTSGDRGERDQLGAFVKEIQQALLQNEVDAALHCLKDLPTEPVGGLQLSAHLQREDPRDAFISRGESFDDLPHGATIGTGSVRRTSQLAAKRPDLKFKPLVGNIDTRMRKLMSGEYDAIILAIAGLRRLGVLETWQESEYRGLVVQPLDTEVMVPAPGQAVLVLETRAGDSAAIQAVRTLHDASAEACATAERAFLQSFGGGCSVPVAAIGRTEGGDMLLTGLVAAPDGSKVLRLAGVAPEAEGVALAKRLAQTLSEQGARDLFAPTTASSGGTEH